MNTELFIARRLLAGGGSTTKISRPIVTIAVAGIALGITVMLISIAVVAGFKDEIRSKVFGFGSHIQIINHDENYSYETRPVSSRQEFAANIAGISGVNHVQVFATKPGIIKTGENVQGIILKGFSTDFNWNFFDNYMISGKHPVLTDSVKSNEVVISQKLASMLNLKVNDRINVYFIQNPPRVRKFAVAGIYQTCLEEFDKLFVLADIRHIQKLNNWDENMVSGFEITIDDFGNIDRITDKIFDEAGSVIQPDGTKLKVLTIMEKYPYIFDWIGLFNTNLWIILVLMVLVAGFNMVSGLLILILERANMIGILKALGAEDARIRKIFLYNGAFLISRGMLWGNIFGLGICFLQHRFHLVKLDQVSYYVDYVPVSVSFSNVIFLNAAAMVVILLMLVLPSFVISRITPVKAIKFN